MKNFKINLKVVKTEVSCVCMCLCVYVCVHIVFFFLNNYILLHDVWRPLFSQCLVMTGNPQEKLVICSDIPKDAGR